MTTQKQSLYGLDLKDSQIIVSELNLPKYRAEQLLDWLYQKNISALNQAKNLPATFIKHLQENYAVQQLQMEKPLDDHKDSQKFLFKTHDNRYLESVLICQKDRKTVCVSTQLGCKIGCTFCASGKGAFGRNLSVGEIIEQIAWIQQFLNQKITNVVFMGMGEPLDNFEATMKALTILESDWGFGISARKITVSTSGITPKIIEFVKRNNGRIRLSISLHSSLEEKRSELVPINRKYSLKELVQTLHEMNPKLSRKITFEYTLIKGENDSEKEAQGVARIAKPLDAMINLIPYNPIQEMDYETPTDEAVKKFRTILTKKGLRVTVRNTAGRDINAACGQLRLDRERR